MKGAEYEYDRLANSVFVLGIVSSESAVERVWRVATCWTIALLLLDYDLQLYILGQLYQNKTFYIFSSVFLADRTNGRAIGTVLRLSVCLSFLCLSVTLCIVAKRCVLEQKLLLRAYRKSYVRNRLVPK